MYVRSKLVAVAAAIALLTLAVVATAAVKPPRSVAGARRIVFCSNLGYPPM